MDKVSWVVGEGPLVTSAEGCQRYLEQRGYSARAVRERMELVVKDVKTRTILRRLQQVLLSASAWDGMVSAGP
jgi:hypothetical protein